MENNYRQMSQGLQQWKPPIKPEASCQSNVYKAEISRSLKTIQKLFDGSPIAFLELA